MSVVRIAWVFVLEGRCSTCAAIAHSHMYGIVCEFGFPYRSQTDRGGRESGCFCLGVSALVPRRRCRESEFPPTGKIAPRSAVLLCKI